MESQNLQAILQTYYLEQKGFPGEVQVSGFSHIQAGWESDIYTFDLLDGEYEPLELILRIYPGAEAFEKSGREFRNLNLLAQADFPVPKAYILERENSPFGNPFIIIERIPGKMLWQNFFQSPANSSRI